MQTFLPYADFKETAASLDMRRLGKQRVENLQIMKALVDPTYGWQNHPAVKMWRGWENSLLNYQLAICYEWTETRHFKDTCWDKTLEVLKGSPFIENRTEEMFIVPDWLGDEDFHRSHQSNLIRKDPEFYQPQFPDVPDNLDYIWPV